MRASKGDKGEKTEANIAAETSTDGLDEASAEEVERLIAELGLVYERKVRAKEEMVELPAEPLAAGILPDDLTEMVEAAEPRKPTLGVGRGRGLEGLRQVPGARCLPTPNHASPRFTTPPHSSPIPSPLLTTPHHSPPRLTRLGCYGSEAEHRAGDGRSNVDARQIPNLTTPHVWVV